MLARRDRKLGGLTADEEGFIYHTTREILDRLFDQASAAPDDEEAGAKAAPSLTVPDGQGVRARALILGCPAHHQAEELSLSMLAQLVKTDGCKVEVISTKVLPAEIEVQVEREKPALVFIAVLPPGGLVQAAYLCKRLRKRFADLPIIVGYWGEARDFDKLLVRLRSAGPVTSRRLCFRAKAKFEHWSIPPRRARKSLSSRKPGRLDCPRGQFSRRRTGTTLGRDLLP